MMALAPGACLAMKPSEVVITTRRAGVGAGAQLFDSWAAPPGDYRASVPPTAGGRRPAAGADHPLGTETGGCWIDPRGRDVIGLTGEC
jgi:hypothetical protein